VLPDSGGGPSYTCRPVPSACTSDISCACIQSAVGAHDPSCTSNSGATCSEDGSNGVTLQCGGA
jgi:hypothetical protein